MVWNTAWWARQALDLRPLPVKMESIFYVVDFSQFNKAPRSQLTTPLGETGILAPALRPKPCAGPMSEENSGMRCKGRAPTRGPGTGQGYFGDVEQGTESQCVESRSAYSFLMKCPDTACEKTPMSGIARRPRDPQHAPPPQGRHRVYEDAHDPPQRRVCWGSDRLSRRRRHTVFWRLFLINIPGEVAFLSCAEAQPRCVLAY
jgi:hypothetical protein